MSEEEKEEYTRVYTGSEVNALHLKSLLEEQGIPTRSRNDFDSGLRAGFGGGIPPGQVLLFAKTEYLEKALRITEETFPGENK